MSANMEAVKLEEAARQAMRIEDMAEALLGRVVENDTVTMTLLSEIKEKARVVYRLIEDESMTVGGLVE